jgi:hypothetical protein
MTPEMANLMSGGNIKHQILALKQKHHDNQDFII